MLCNSKTIENLFRASLKESYAPSKLENIEKIIDRRHDDDHAENDANEQQEKGTGVASSLIHSEIGWDEIGNL
jgi:hypothetical protein